MVFRTASLRLASSSGLTHPMSEPEARGPEELDSAAMGGVSYRVPVMRNGSVVPSGW